MKIHLLVYLCHLQRCVCVSSVSEEGIQAECVRAEVHTQTAFTPQMSKTIYRKDGILHP